MLHAKNASFNPFREGHAACFAPTFKLKPGAEQFKKYTPDEVYNQQRLASYTDRILFWSESLKNENELQVLQKQLSVKSMQEQITHKLSQHVLSKFKSFDQEKCEWFESPLREFDLLQLVNYDSNNSIKISDHRPVFAQFMLLLD